MRAGSEVKEVNKTNENARNSLKIRGGGYSLTIYSVEDLLEKMTLPGQEMMGCKCTWRKSP